MLVSEGCATINGGGFFWMFWYSRVSCKSVSKLCESYLRGDDDVLVYGLREWPFWGLFIATRKCGRGEGGALGEGLKAKGGVWLVLGSFWTERWLNERNTKRTDEKKEQTAF
jgi:hypothetical protein